MQDITGPRASGRTTEMIKAAVDYARNNQEKQIMIVAADRQHIPVLRSMINQETNGFNAQFKYVSQVEWPVYYRKKDTKVFWDHYAAECSYENECLRAYLTYVDRLDYSKESD